MRSAFQSYMQIKDTFLNNRDPRPVERLEEFSPAARRYADRYRKAASWLLNHDPESPANPSGL